MLTVKILDEETGVRLHRIVPAEMVRKITHYYGKPLARHESGKSYQSAAGIASSCTFRSLLSSTYEVLTIHNSRRAIVSALANSAPGRSLRSIEEAGGASNLLQLLKLSASSESCLNISGIDTDENFGRRAKYLTPQVRTLCRKVLDLLEDGAESEKLSCVLVRDCVENIKSALERTHTADEKYYLKRK